MTPRRAKYRRIRPHERRSRYVLDRHQITVESIDVSERLIGLCALCGRAHGCPDVRLTCTRCGELRCHGWCGCEEGEE